MGPIEWGIGVAIASGSVGTMIMAILVLRTLLRRWSGRPPALPSHEVNELRAGLDRLGQDVAELHERVDFTERIMSREHDPARLRERS
jgi:hypothetical protein